MLVKAEPPWACAQPLWILSSSAHVWRYVVICGANRVAHKLPVPKKVTGNPCLRGGSRHFDSRLPRHLWGIGRKVRSFFSRFFIAELRRIPSSSDSEFRDRSYSTELVDVVRLVLSWAWQLLRLIALLMM